MVPQALCSAVEEFGGEVPRTAGVLPHSERESVCLSQLDSCPSMSSLPAMTHMALAALSIWPAHGAQQCPVAGRAGAGGRLQRPPHPGIRFVLSHS